MLIVKAGAEPVERETPYQFLEKIGRTCYKSEDKITDESAEKFVKNLIKRGHLSVLEHERLYFAMSSKTFVVFRSILGNHFSKYVDVVHGELCPIAWYDTNFGVYTVSMNLRTAMEMWNVFMSICSVVAADFMTVLSALYPELFDFPHKFVTGFVIDNMVSGYEVKLGSIVAFNSKESFIKWVDYMSKSRRFLEWHHPKRLSPEEWKNLNYDTHVTHTVRIVCDRGVTHELVRHREASYSQESTRYCNYSLGKFGNEITVIEPQPTIFNDGMCDLDYQRNLCVKACELSEQYYRELIKSGATPQEARSVLPNSLKTEIVMTATEVNWKHILNVRLRGKKGTPHPQMVEVMKSVSKVLRALSDERVW